MKQWTIWSVCCVPGNVTHIKNNYEGEYDTILDSEKVDKKREVEMTT